MACKTASESETETLAVSSTASRNELIRQALDSLRKGHITQVDPSILDEVDAQWSEIVKNTPRHSAVPPSEQVLPDGLCHEPGFDHFWTYTYHFKLCLYCNKVERLISWVVHQ